MWNDYKRLEKELFELKQNQEKLVQRIRTYPDDAEFQQDLIACNAKIADTLQEIEDFKTDVFRLHEQFTRIPLNTERLRRAKEHFDKGEFREADAVLKAEEITAEVEELQAVERVKEEELAAVRKDLADRANEFLIKAQIALLSSSPEGSSRFEMAEGWFEQALAVARTTEILFGYALILQERHAFSRAEPLYQDALKEYRCLAEAKSKAFLPKIATTLNNLANVHLEIGKYDSAHQEYEESLVIRKELAEVTPEEFLPDVAQVLNNLANLYQKEGNYDLALEKYKDSLKIKRSLAKSNPDAFLPDLAGTLNNLGVLYYKKEEYSLALKEYREALKIRQRLAESNPDTFLPDMAETRNNLANLYAARPKYGSALKEYENALDIYRGLAEENPGSFLPHISLSLNNIGVRYTALKKYEPALEKLKEALAIRKELAAINPKPFLRYVAQTHNNLANLYIAKENFESAQKEYQDALNIYRDLVNSDSKFFILELVQILLNLSIFYLKNVPDKAKSIAYAQEARDILIPLCKQAPHLQGELDKAEQLLKLNNTKPNA